MSLRLIIFDLDGTLVDSAADITNAVNYAFEPYNMEPVTNAEVIGLVGEGSVRLIEKISKTRNVDVQKNVVISRFVEYYSSHLTDYTQTYPEVRETLMGLEQYRKAVVSNKFSAFSGKVIDALDLSSFFDMIVSGDTLPERKPSPEPIRYVLSSLNIGADETIIVGDSVVDVETGRASSVRTVAVTYGYGQNGFWQKADFVIDTFSELTGILRDFE
jgi:phosphoglycolate phosphatase